MKHPSNVINDAFVNIHLHELLATAKAHLGSLAQRVLKAAGPVILAMQVGRMKSVLTALTDEQLEQIGVQRKDIDRHAHKLINYEYDGL